MGSLHTRRRSLAVANAECPVHLLATAERVPRDLDVMRFSVVQRGGMPPAKIESAFD